jgi:hypothetical protein
MLQLSMVFNQAKWPGAGDIDDCWVVSAVQAVNVTSPWLRLVGVSVFRKHAQRPDNPDTSDGGRLVHIVRGIEGCYPSLSGHVRKMAGVPWSTMLAAAAEGRPLSLAIDSSRLPVDLAFGFRGLHQVTAVEIRPGVVWYANPLARPYSRWLQVTWEDLRAAVMGYGKLRTSEPCAYAVALPTASEALALYSPSMDTTPFDQEDMDDYTAGLQAKIDAAREALGD